MPDNTLNMVTLMAMIVVVVAVVGVVVVEGGSGAEVMHLSHVSADNGVVEFGKARNFHPDQINVLHEEEEEDVVENVELEDLHDFEPLAVTNVDEDMDEEEKAEEKTEMEEGEGNNNEREGEEGNLINLELEEHDTKLMNLIEMRPELVTMNPAYAHDTSLLDDNHHHHNNDHKHRNREEGGGKPRRRGRPHNSSRKARRERRRRRRWKKRMKEARKFYRANRTFKWGAKNNIHHPNFNVGGTSSNQRHQWKSPNRRSGYVSLQGYRSLDPRRLKVRRHLVRQHNLLRATVDPAAADMLAVKWYRTAAEQAQTWAEQCDQDNHAEQHPSVRWSSNYGACGQNVFVSPTKKRWTQVLEHWWSGKKNFTFGKDFTANNNNNNNNNHNDSSSLVAAYTQMAWYNSHQVGCGFSQCYNPGGSTFRYVCNYCPGGNDPSRLARPYTKGSTCSLCPGSCRSMCPRRRCPLCTNACTYSDLWVNCAQLDQQWHEWLCNTKTAQGVERFKSCRATCQCVNEIT